MIEEEGDRLGPHPKGDRPDRPGDRDVSAKVRLSGPKLQGTATRALTARGTPRRWLLLCSSSSVSPPQHVPSPRSQSPRLGCRPIIAKRRGE
jgi:hypothetical protein